MKKIFCVAITVLSLSACGDAKKQEDALKKEVIDFHEKVMADDEKAMINKMKLDTLILKADSLKINKLEVAKLDTNLVAASDAMSKWMSNLNLDYKGMSHDEIMKYLNEQKKAVIQIDSMYVSATNESAQYLKKLNK